MDSGATPRGAPKAPPDRRWSEGYSTSRAHALPTDGESPGRPAGLAFEERTFTVEEAYQAREAFITSASQTVLPVVKIDGRPVGNGAPGLIASALRRDYHRYAEVSR